MPYTCPECGHQVETLYEGYCGACRDYRQMVLDEHNANYERWLKMNDEQREKVIHDRMRETI